MSTSPPDRFPVPSPARRGHVDREQEFERDIEALRRRGFDSDRWDVLNGARDARNLDVEGDAHGVSGKVTRALQQAVSFEGDHVRRHAEHLRTGG